MHKLFILTILLFYLLFIGEKLLRIIFYFFRGKWTVEKISISLLDENGYGRGCIYSWTLNLKFFEICNYDNEFGMPENLMQT